MVGDGVVRWAAARSNLGSNNDLALKLAKISTVPYEEGVVMHRQLPSISVIIGTLAEARRRDSLYRAIGSVTSQHGVTTIPIVVVNGERFDPSLVAELRLRADIRYCYLTEASLPGAVRQGRRMVATPYFCFLDDDDEYLPGALQGRAELLAGCVDADAIVGGGFRAIGNRRTNCGWESGDALVHDPLRELLTYNWLPSCGALFRTARIDCDFFDDMPRFLEWTHVAFKLCLMKRLIFSAVAGHVVHDTEESVSKSSAFKLVQPTIFQSLLLFDLPSDVRRALKVKYGSALHVVSDHYRSIGKFGYAWQFHVRSMLQPKGLRYLPYTRRLVRL